LVHLAQFRRTPLGNSERPTPITARGRSRPLPNDRCRRRRPTRRAVERAGSGGASTVSTSSSLVGCRAEIVTMLHSPARTRASASLLLGHRGTVVGVLRNSTLALLELDGQPHDMPRGVRRWAVHWDDLLVHTDQAGTKQARDYRLGLSNPDRNAMQHAAPAKHEVSLCGEAVHPLPTLGWCLPFVPTATRACPTCVLLAEGPD
jgi:hypothetical protein